MRLILMLKAAYGQRLLPRGSAESNGAWRQLLKQKRKTQLKMVKPKNSRIKRSSEEDPGESGVDPGRQDNVSGQWRGRLRSRATRREEPEEATVNIGKEELETPQCIGDGDQSEINQNGPLSTNVPSEQPEGKRKGRGQPWKKEEKDELLWCFYYCQEKGNDDYRNVYKTWRERNPIVRANMNPNTLQTQRRYIERAYPHIEKEQLKTKAIRQARDELMIKDSENSQRVRHTQAHPDEQLNELIPQIVLRMEQPQERKHLRKIPRTAEAAKLISKGNDALGQILKEHHTLLEINDAIYATAEIITNTLLKTRKENNNEKRTPKSRTPPWEIRLCKKIEHLRKDLSILVELKEGRVKKKKANEVTKKWNIGKEKALNEVIEDLKQRAAATAQRLRRYKKRCQQYQENRLFNSDTKKFYRALRSKEEDGEPPDPDTIEIFWKEIYENESKHNEGAPWIKQLERVDTPKMDWEPIREDEVKAAITKTQNWKAAGTDCIPNFWIKELHTTHVHLAREYNKMIDSCNIPEWLTRGKTLLLAKNNNTQDPKNYRPITCLNTTYKNLTSILTERVTKHMIVNNLLPIEQKGCCRGSRGCKDHLLLSKAIVEDCKKFKKSLSMGWIDYKKAFDSVPHTWLIKATELVGINESIIEFLRALVKTWRTRMHIVTREKQITTKEILVKRGIYQGDSLSPLLFCIALIPLTSLLKDTQTGYKITNTNERINHLLYMDDLKLIASNKAQLNRLLATTKTFSDDIKMEFGLDKCAVVSFKRGKLEQMENISLDDECEIGALEPGSFYKYLGVAEGDGVDHEGTKEKLQKEYIYRVRKILRTELNARNKISAIGALAVPVIQYSVGIINWKMEEIKQLDIKTRKLLTMHGALHPKSDTCRLYVSRSKGGRGLKQLEASTETEIYSLAFYMTQKAHSNYLLQATMQHDQERHHYSLIKRALTTAKQIKIGEEPEPTILDMPLPKLIKQKIRNRTITKWKEKPMHGKLARDMDSLKIDKGTSFAWLRNGQLKSETESLLVAAQEQAVKTRYIEHRIMNTRRDEMCRMCKEKSETVTHIMSACSVLAQREYIERHNRVCSLIHYEICQFYKCEPLDEKWYLHKPEKVIMSGDGKTTILYDHPIRTDRTMTGQNEEGAPNRPDIVVRDEKITYLIDVAVPADTNIVRKEAEKHLKYKSLSIEIQRMWRTKVVIIPIVIGSTGYVSEEYENYVKQLPGVHQAGKIQQTAILGTAHILRKVLS